MGSMKASGVCYGILSGHSILSPLVAFPVFFSPVRPCYVQRFPVVGPTRAIRKVFW